MVLSAATGSVDLKTATLSPVRLPSSQPKVVVLSDNSLASAATCFRIHMCTVHPTHVKGGAGVLYVPAQLTRDTRKGNRAG